MSVKYAAVITLAALVVGSCDTPMVRAQGAGGQPSIPKGDVNVIDDLSKHKFTNRLAQATSPYLLQHAHNPVDWFEWGEAAFRKAEEEDKPIFLSIGYSSCHWCHVMEHESFEDEEVADMLRAHFIAIKVDREERPDIDELYMAYTQQRTGRGGWPMSIWATPNGTPFEAGTYFPKAQFLQILDSIGQAWQNQRQSLLEKADGARNFFARWSAEPEPAEGMMTRSAVDRTAALLGRYFDLERGGTRSGGNKFPPSMSMDLLLRVHRRTGDSDLYAAVSVTLDQMARGGIYDQLGGGICRYSTDPNWLVPHFEKMLYDQALVSAIYLDAFQVSHNALYARVAADIMDYVIYDFQSPEGGLFSSRDADSDGLEGKFYIWTVEQVNAVLGQADGQLFCDYYGVTKKGNWFEHRGHAPSGPKNILHMSQTSEAFAKEHNMSTEELQAQVKSWREKLLPVRAKRVAPGLDDKVLTGWNGLMIASLAKGGRVLDNPKYTKAAAKAADFILKNLRKDGRLLRTWRKGESRLTAYLSDYAFFIEGLINLYEATFDTRWLNEASALADTSIEYYYDDKGGGFFFTASDGEVLLARSKNPHDGAIPSGNSVHALNLLRLAILLDRKDYREKAESIFRSFASRAERSPGAFERLFCALDFYHDRVKEIAIIGDPDAEETASLIRAVYANYLPNKVVAGAPDLAEDTTMLLLKGKTKMRGKSAAYVCENYRCKLPVTEPSALLKQLGGAIPASKAGSAP